MRVQFVPEKTELSLLYPENLIVVKNSESRVLIRVTHDNFSEQEKIVLIRYLAAEGFISDEFENFRKSGWHGSPIIWTVSRKPVNRVRGFLKSFWRFMIQLFACP